MSADANDYNEHGDLGILDLVVSGDWLDAQVFPPTQWAVPGLIPEGFGLFTGPPKVGKSWLALSIGLAVAAGTQALGKINTGHPRPVLYLALEDGHKRLQWRARKLLRGRSIPANLDVVTTATPAQIMPLLSAWLDKHEGENPLVMLDTLGKVMPPSFPGESAYQRDYRVGGHLKGIVDEHVGACLLVVHHVRKMSGEDWMDSTSGTNGLNGSADFTLNLHRKRNEDTGLLRVTGRDVQENEYAVAVDDGTWTLDGDDLTAAAEQAMSERESSNLGDVSMRVLEYVKAQDRPVTAKEVSEALDLPRARDYLLRLVESDRMRKAGRGLYEVTVASVASVANGEGESPDSPGLWQVRNDGLNATDATDATPLYCPRHGTDHVPDRCATCEDLTERKTA